MELTQPKFISMTVLFVTLSLLIVINSGCTSPRPALSKYHNNFNFSQVSSYRFYDRNSQFSDFQNISDATRNSIEIAIEQVLDKNDFVYQLTDDTDIIVTYHLISDNLKDLAEYNKGVGYCSYCLRGGGEEKERKQWKIGAGSLILDIINPKKQRSIWRSVYDLKIKESKDNSQNVQMKIHHAITTMMEEYPYAHEPNALKDIGSQ